MKGIPCVTGFKFEQATDLLTSLGYNVSVIPTYSPIKKERVGECRVIRQINTQKSIELTIGYF